MTISLNASNVVRISLRAESALLSAEKTRPANFLRLFSEKIKGVVLISGLLLSTLVAVVSIAAGPPNAAPTPPIQVRGLGNSQVALQNGAFTTNTSIAVPAFHGVTPSLGLNYSSSGSNGFVGVGYSLSGLPEFEREYKSGTTVIRYEGEPLVVSSALGGNYATIRQSFLKINFTGSGSTVTRADGTVMTFTTIASNKWGVSSVRDIHGNTANYTWTQDSGNGVLYPSTISYGNAVVTFNKELRSDEDIYATGSNDLAKRRYRLKSIAVTVNGTQLRSYELTYGYSARTGRSMLKNIQQFGRNSANLPASTATWSDNTTGFENVADISNSYGLTAAIWANSSFQNGDFNGDGKEDLLVRYNNSTTVYLLLANNTGGFNNAVNITNLYGMDSSRWKNAAVNPGDFNGDGKTDLLLQVPYSPLQLAPAEYYAYTLIANNNGGFESKKDVTSSTGIGAYNWGFTVRTGDFNGDGMTDLLFPNQNTYNTTTRWASVAYASGTGSFGYASQIQASSAISASQWSISTLTLADFNGDGRTDVLAQIPGSGNIPNKAVVLLAKTLSGSPLFSGGTDITTLGGLTTTDWLCANVTPGDFNGDGKVDVLIKKASNCAWVTYPKLLYANGDQGNSFANPIDITNLYGMTAESWHDSNLSTGDFNGDGRTDLFAFRNNYTPSANHHVILESKGNGFNDGRIVDTSYGMTKTNWAFVDRIGDFDGDGDDDMFLHASASGGKIPPKILKAGDTKSNV
ncbi:MAG: FG-GAP-like repeat-containing protein, partial [Arenimonas sp.]